MAWNNFSPQAEWKTKWFATFEGFVRHCSMLSKPIHQLFHPLEQGGLGIHPMRSYMDSLHVVDLGVAMHLCGNVLHLLCYDVLPGTTAANMSSVWQEVSRLYGDRDTSSQFAHLDLRSFCDPAKPHAGFPLLKGKGAQIRHLAPILALIWRQHIRPDNRYDMHVEKVLDNLVLFYRCLDFTDSKGLHPFHLPQQIAQRLLKHVDQFLWHYFFLAEDSLRRVPAKCLWSIVPKHHYFWHLAMQANDLNPRMSWCYANEDVVGNIAIIGMSCRHGQVAATRSKSLMAKYIMGIILRMHHAS